LLGSQTGPHAWYVSSDSLPKVKIYSMICTAILKILGASNISAFASQTLFRITGKINNKNIVKMTHKSIYLILFHAFWILSSAHAEKINKKIA